MRFLKGFSLRWQKGGIHPISRKNKISKSPLRELVTAPPQIILPFTSPCGERVRPVVQVGDTVSWGDVVAVPESEEAVPLHSGISGTVVAVGQCPHPFLGLSHGIVIENDETQRKTLGESIQSLEGCSSDFLLSLIKERGIQGMSRDTRSVYRKVLDAQWKVSTLIVNACECEPYLASDHRLLEERKENILFGSQALALVLGAKAIVIAIQADKVETMVDYEVHPFWNDGLMSVKTLPSRYPFGEEKQVVSLIMKKELRPSQYCHEAQCTLFNVATVQAVGESLRTGMPQTHRSFTVSGAAIASPCNLWLPIGTPLTSVLENVGGKKRATAVHLLGGAMTGCVPESLSSPILVNSSGYLALSSWEVPKQLYFSSQKEEQERAEIQVPCIRCGNCVRVCPRHLRPYLVYQSMAHLDIEQVEACHPEECISCGCCNYSCPAHLTLAQTMQKAQDYLQELLLQQEVVETVEMLDETVEMLDKTEEMLDETEEMLDETVETLDETVETLDETEAMLDVTEEMLDETVETLDKTVETLDETEEMLDVTEEMLDVTEEMLDETVETLDETVETLEETEEMLEETMETLEETVETLEEIVETLDDSVETLEETEEMLEETEEMLEETEEMLDVTEEMLDETEELLDETEETLDVTEEMLDETEEMLDVTEEMLDVTEEMLDETVEILDETEEILDKTEEMLDETEEMLDETEEMLDETEEMLDVTEEMLDETMETLDETMETLDETVETLEETVETLEETVETLEETVETLEETVETLEETMETLDEIEDMQDETVETLDETVETLEETMETLDEIEDMQDETVETLEETVETTEETVETLDETEEMLEETVETLDETEEMADGTEEEVEKIFQHVGKNQVLEPKSRETLQLVKEFPQLVQEFPQLVKEYPELENQFPVRREKQEEQSGFSPVIQWQLQVLPDETRENTYFRVVPLGSLDTVDVPLDRDENASSQDEKETRKGGEDG